MDATAVCRVDSRLATFKAAEAAAAAAAAAAATATATVHAVCPQISHRPSRVVAEL